MEGTRGPISSTTGIKTMKEGRIESVVSIIIPCYNQAQFLPEAIESALVQTHSRIEVVVVDDGSPDNTAEVAARYSAITCVRQRNLGIAEARNAGFRACHGEYVVFLDADDRLMPNAVAAHLSCFATHPSAGFVVGDIDNIQLDGSYLSSPRWPILEGNEYEELLKGNHVANTIAVMFRRSVIEEVDGFNRSFAPADDVELLLRAAQLFLSAHHRSTVAQYRRYPNSVSRKGAIMLPAILRVMRLQRDIAKGNSRLLNACREGEGCWRDYFGKEALKEVFGHIVRGSPGGAAMSLAVLLWYVRGRLFLWPWIFRQRGLKYLLRRLHKPQKHVKQSASTVVGR
jgi:glycosyltransferase involved in cell wall biosynthesis